MPKTPPLENTVPPPLRGLGARELFILTGIPLELLQGFIEGRFKPSSTDRKKLTDAAVPMYAFSAVEVTAFILRKKYRAIKHYLTKAEKEGFLYDGDDYGKKIDEYLAKYWDRVEQAISGG